MDDKMRDGYAKWAMRACCMTEDTGLMGWRSYRKPMS